MLQPLQPRRTVSQSPDFLDRYGTKKFFSGAGTNFSKIEQISGSSLKDCNLAVTLMKILEFLLEDNYWI